ncbi:MAG: 6-phospho-3-hexuloisomerase [Candidatus Bathyarchaeota archaeon]
MEFFKDSVKEIITSASYAVENINAEDLEKFIAILIEAKNDGKKVLVMGAGRSGLVSRAFAMRLMHLYYNVYVIGETITPAVEKDDILLGISGSGETTIVVAAAKIAKDAGARIVAVTSFPESPLGKLADHSVVLLGRTKVDGKKDYFSRQILGVHEPLAPLGTMFEVSSAIFLDALIVELMHKLGKTEQEMKKRHATIE